MGKQIAVLIVVLLNMTHVNGQHKLILQHKTKAGREKVIDLDREYEIRTNDTIYYSKIVAFTDSSLSIPISHKTGSDTTYTYSYTYATYPDQTFFRTGKPKDTTYSQVIVRPLYRNDTTVILFTDIREIKKDWFKNRGWLRGVVLLGIGGAVAGAFLPFAAIDEGREGVENWLLFEGAVIGIAGPSLFIGTRKTKYNMSKKWRLEAEPLAGSKSR